MGNVHVVNGDVAVANVAEALRLLGVDERIVNVRDSLDLGPLGDLHASREQRDAFWREVLGGDYGEDDRSAWAAIRAARSVTVWYGRDASESILPFAVAASLDAEVALVGVEVGGVPRLAHLPDRFRATRFAEPAELARAFDARALVDGRAMTGRWKEIVSSSTTMFRGMEGGRLVERPVEACDESMVASCGDDWTASARIVARLLDAWGGDQVLFWRLRTLVASGRLEGLGELPSGCPREVRRKS